MATSARSKSKRPSAKKTNRSARPTRAYTVLRSSKFDPTKKLSSQGKTVNTTRNGAYVAAAVAIKKRSRPTRIYLCRNKRVLSYRITYYTGKNGKLKAEATYTRSSSSGKKTKFLKKKSSPKTKTKKKCLCTIKGSCKKTKGACKKKSGKRSSGEKAVSRASRPVFRVSSGKLHVSVNGRRSVVSRAEKDKLIRIMGSRRMIA